MVLDKIENAGLYACFGGRLAKGLELIQDRSLYDKDPGSYEVEGDDLFYMIQHYTTKATSDARFEAHQAYADIQAVVEGSEMIGWAPADELRVVEPYKPDICFFSDPERYTELTLREGTFAVFFPADAHKPCCALREKRPVVKLVVKVKL